MVKKEKAANVKKRLVTKTESKDAKRNSENNKSTKKTNNGFHIVVFIIIIILGVTLGILLSSKYFTSSVFVSVNQHVERAAFDVPCSDDYNDESFHDCKPRRCGRVVMDNLVSQNDAQHLLSVAQKGLALGGSSGGASILDLHSGALSKDNAFIDIYKLLKAEKINLLNEKDFSIYKKVKNQIHDAIADEFGIPKNKLYLTKPTFFSRMNMTKPKTIHDEYWHSHVDKETYGSFHYTSLLYLATYKQDFDGGRFVFVDKDVNRTVEPKLGRVSFFTSGSENVHFVERLKDGVRYAITVSFTCDPEKAIADPESR